MNKRLLFILLIGAFLSGCADETTDNNNTEAEESTESPQSIEDIKVPPRENPVEYWKMKSIKVQYGEKGYLRSTHKVEPQSDESDPNPIKVTRKDNKILKIAAGDYNDKGEIVGRTDFYFENEQLAYVEGMDYKIYIHNDTIQEWLDDKGKHLQKETKTQKEWVDSLKNRISEIMDHVGLKFNYQNK